MAIINAMFAYEEFLEDYAAFTKKKKKLIFSNVDRIWCVGNVWNTKPRKKSMSKKFNM